MVNASSAVFVIATNREAYPVLDLFRSIQWSCQESHYVVIVDYGGNVKFPDDVKDGYAILNVKQEGRPAEGFFRGLGIRWAIDKGIKCKQFVLLDDACLLIQPGIDTWALERFQQASVGLLGVIDRLNYEDAFRRCAAWMDLWSMPHTNFEPGPHTIHEAVSFLSWSAAMSLYQKNLLVPDGCEQWPISYGPFISWAVQMLGHYMVGWGHMDKQMPPLFVGYPRSRLLVPPHVLSPKFGLYYSLRHMLAYSEGEIREAYKKLRGEDAKIVTPYRPAVFPQPTGPTVLG